jgi:glutathione S-transferase
MELFFSPLACSMATRISLYEAGANARYTQVDGKTKQTLDGRDFLTVNPLGLVPALRNDDGVVLTENAAILQYIADRLPDADLAPREGIERSRLQQWLCFIGTELHKVLFSPLLARDAPDGAKAFAIAKGEGRLDYLNRHLADHEFLLNKFSVADAYLFTVLHWSRATPQIDLARWPALKAYVERLRQRPSIARALSEELALYEAEQARHKAA